MMDLIVVTAIVNRESHGGGEIEERERLEHLSINEGR